MITSIVSKSTYYPISIDELKSHIRMKIGQTIEDDALNIFRNAAITYTEKYLNRKLSKQTVKYYLDDFPKCDWIELPFPPIRNIPSSGLVYTNSTNGSTTFSSTKWSQDIISEPGRLVLNYNDDWPTGITLANNNPISIEYQCGYGSTKLGSVGSTNIDLPADIKNAVLMIAGIWYENREEYVINEFGNNFVKVPVGARELLYNYRIKTF